MIHHEKDKQPEASIECYRRSINWRKASKDHLWLGTPKNQTKDVLFVVKLKELINIIDYILNKRQPSRKHGISKIQKQEDI